MAFNGKTAATAGFSGSVNNQRADIRLVAVSWSPDTIYRFQIAIPQGTGGAVVDELKRATYSLRAMTEDEKRNVEPYRLDIVTARPGDTVPVLAARMPFDTYREERFRVLNALEPGEQIVPGRRYKIVVGG